MLRGLPVSRNTNPPPDRDLLSPIVLRGKHPSRSPYRINRIFAAVKCIEQDHSTTLGDILRGSTRRSSQVDEVEALSASFGVFGPLSGWLAPFVPKQTPSTHQKEAKRQERRRNVRRLLYQCRKQATLPIPSPMRRRPVASIDDGAVSNAVSFFGSSAGSGGGFRSSSGSLDEEIEKNDGAAGEPHPTAAENHELMKEEMARRRQSSRMTDGSFDGSSDNEKGSERLPSPPSTAWKTLQKLRMGDGGAFPRLLPPPSSSSSSSLQMFRVLPWLFALPGSLETLGAEIIASNYALSKLQVIDMERISTISNSLSAITSTDGTKGPGPRWIFGRHVAWVGSSVMPGAVLAGAAALHRASHRCGGAATDLKERDGAAAVLTFDGMLGANTAAASLALYLHLFCHFEPKEALNAAGAVFKIDPPPESSLDTGVEAAAAIGQGWLQRVVLKWPYWVGKRIEVTGDLVGGWNCRVPMVWSERQGIWRTQLWGIPPGVHQYKFIVDGRWCADLARPSMVDEYGNVNNIVSVVGCHKITAAVRVAGDSDGMAAAASSAMKVGGGSDWDWGLDDTNDFERIEMAVSPGERLRLARFGASVLAYYCKSKSEPQEGVFD